MVRDAVAYAAEASYRLRVAVASLRGTCRRDLVWVYDVSPPFLNVWFIDGKSRRDCVVNPVCVGSAGHRLDV